MRRLFRLYGASPLHLLSLLGCFALAGYAVLRIVHASQGTQILVWFLGAIIAHDFVLFPLYALADRSVTGLTRRTRRGSAPAPAVPWINHLRAPVLLSGLLLLVWFPLILGLAEPRYHAATGLRTNPYLGRWLLVTGALFAASALTYALRRGRERRRAAG